MVVTGTIGSCIPRTWQCSRCSTKCLVIFPGAFRSPSKTCRFRDLVYFGASSSTGMLLGQKNNAVRRGNVRTAKKAIGAAYLWMTAVWIYAWQCYPEWSCSHCRWLYLEKKYETNFNYLTGAHLRHCKFSMVEPAPESIYAAANWPNHFLLSNQRKRAVWRQPIYHLKLRE